jgi:hypothetical protein
MKKANFNSETKTIPTVLRKCRYVKVHKGAIRGARKSAQHGAAAGARATFTPDLETGAHKKALASDDHRGHCLPTEALM